MTKDYKEKFDEAMRLYRQHKVKESIEILVALLKSDGQNKYLLYQIGKACFELGYHKTAIKYLETCMNLYPGNHLPRIKLAEVYEALGKDDTAEITLKECYRKTGYPYAHFRLGKLYVKQKRYWEAENEFKLYSELDNKPHGYFELGKCLLIGENMMRLLIHC